jgi:formylglycine-generating enzyme required for sulfatase activity
MSDLTTFNVVVRPVSVPPELAAIGSKLVKPGELLLIPVKVTNVGRPAGQLVFALATDSPTGAEIDSQTGVIRWHLDPDTAAGQYSFTVQARNPAHPALSDQVTFQVTVLETDHAVQRDTHAREPLELAPIDYQLVDVGSLILFAVRTANSEAGELEYSLAPDAPAGAFINARTGLFTWRPAADQAAQQVPITVYVRDTESPERRAHWRFFVRVKGAERPSEPEQPVKPAYEETPLQLDERPVPMLISPTPQQDATNDREHIQQKEHEEELVPLPKSSVEPEVHRELDVEATPADDSDGSFVNSIGMKLMPIFEGTFRMGSSEAAEDLAQLNEAEIARFRDEQPQHPVRISRPFYLGKFEVTVAQFRRFVEETGYKTDADRDGGGAYAFNTEKGEFEWGKTFGWTNCGWSQTGDHPVVNVSWNDANAFCRWLSEAEGCVYRLPTEAEWEFACRAGTETRYSTGDSLEQLVGAANLGDESFRQIIRPDYSEIVLVEGHDGPAFTTPAGKFRPNEFGLHDMHGNVFEWCGDWYGASYYEHSPLVDPTGPASGTKRVFRGGSFFNSPFYSRSSFRNGFPPQARVPYLGFRVVLEMERQAGLEQNDQQN